MIKSYLSERHQRVLIDNIKANDSISSNWEEVKNGVLEGLIFGPLLFLFCINIVPNITAKHIKIVLCVDDTNIIVTNLNSDGFKIEMNRIFIDINKWFRTNLLSLNLKKNSLSTI